MRSHLTGVLAATLLGVGLVIGAPVVLQAGSADAAPGRCEPGTGVTVVVDFGALGGGVPIGCDPSGGGKAASQAVTAAGFTVTYVNGQPFVCRIEGKPSADQESCQRTPPADAYWGLFWSDGKSGTWTYSSQGIASLKVPEGGSIGLRWQDGGDREQPGAAPTPAPKAEPAPSPKPSSTQAPKPGPGKPATPSAAPQTTSPTGASPATPSPAQSTAVASTSAPAKSASPSKRPRRDRTPRVEDTPSESVTVYADPTQGTGVAEGELTGAAEVAAQDGDETGGSGLTWLAALVVLALAAGVVVTAARRRRT